MNPPTVYLAGPITGLNYDGATDWRKAVSSALWSEHGIVAYSPMRNKEYLQLETTIGDAYDNKVLSNQAAITARDRFDVMRCDAVLFNFLATTKVSIGTCIEVGWADAFRKPSVLLIEAEGAVHDHSMVRQICGWRTSTVEQAVAVLGAVLNP